MVLPGQQHWTSYFITDVRLPKHLSLDVLFGQGYPCPRLNCVQGLCMYISSLNDDLVPAMIFLLTGMLNLKTLRIKSSALLANTNVSRGLLCSTKSCATLGNFISGFGERECKKLQREIKSSKASKESRFIALCRSGPKSCAKLHYREGKSLTPSDNNTSGFDATYWDSQNLRFICHLETVEMELFDGTNALELALFLLKHAKKLKKMVVFHSPSLPSDTYTKIQNCRACSAATVVFQEK